MLKVFAILMTALMIFVPTPAAQGEQAGWKVENVGEAIAYLIEKIASSELKFIRNDEEHSSEEAAQHIRQKYEHFKSRIETPEDFIRLCASKSMVSGKPYLVVTHQGRTPVESWLVQILVEYRKSREIP